VRLLCPACKGEEPFDIARFPGRLKAHRSVSRHYVARGCPECYNTGYKGRMAVYEVIPVDEDLAEQIKVRNFNVNELLMQRGIRTLSENAFGLFEQGLTSLEEIYSLLV
jgi:general secretion pathway protein E/type IV pilus assembly protein PilB